MQTSMSNLGLLNITLICSEENVSRKGIVAAHGVIDVVRQRSFYILVSNFNNSPTRIRRREKIAVASRPRGVLINELLVINGRTVTSQETKTQSQYATNISPKKHERTDTNKSKTVMKLRPNATEKKTLGSPKNKLIRNRALSKYEKSSRTGGKAT